MSLERTKKPKLLVVDDEPDNLDLLYRTFRRDFKVLRAENGVAALEVLAAEGEVAVIISDQRMPEMKGTEFLSKTVPQFPDTMRIILTGFTDVEDLVEAINSGQVCRYITKPWDSEELKAVVHRAAEAYELLKQRTEELQRAQIQITLLNTIVRVTQQMADVEACLSAIAAAYGEAFSADSCILQLLEGKTLGTQGIYGTSRNLKNWLAQDPMTQEAIDSQNVQVAVSLPSDLNLSGLSPYVDAGIQAQLISPILFQQKVLAVLSLQWRQPRAIEEAELALIHLSAQQVGIALACAQNYSTAASFA
jgi:CheY-like chemotaxis protein